MKLADVYPSASGYLAAADLQGKKHRLHIAGWEIKEFKGREGKPDENKVVLQFHGAEKKLVLNKKNATMITEMYGDTFDGWIGKEITIFPTKDYFGDKLVDCIRVEYVNPTQVRQNGSTKATPRAAVRLRGETDPSLTVKPKMAFDERNPPPAEPDDDMNDSVPF